MYIYHRRFKWDVCSESILSHRQNILSLPVLAQNIVLAAWRSIFHELFCRTKCERVRVLFRRQAHHHWLMSIIVAVELLRDILKSIMRMLFSALISDTQLFAFPSNGSLYNIILFVWCGGDLYFFSNAYIDRQIILIMLCCV